MMRYSLLFAAMPLLVQAETPVPWDMAKLEKPPAYRWEKVEGRVHSLFYEGERYQGQATEVFAFYASPATVSGAQPPAGGFPAVVLIHGGGGTGFAEWVYLWAQRGYAAIAMDLGGHRPPDPVWQKKADQEVLVAAAKGDVRTRLPNGGPNQGHPEKFACVQTPDIDDDWPYHAVSNVIRAHSLIRQLPGINPERTAVTGISWGGYTTCIVASVDARFKAAVPVYGCGFLYEGESVQKPAIDQLGDLREEWVRRYDPSRHLVRCQIPMLFVNGTNDVHYPLDSYQKSFESVPHDRKQMRVTVKMAHGHLSGWAPAEIGWYIDHYCRDEVALAKPGEPVKQGKQMAMPYRSERPIRRAQLHYSSDEGARAKREWQSVDAKVTDAAILAPLPPASANTWFITMTDDREATISSEIQFVPAVVR